MSGKSTKVAVAAIALTALAAGGWLGHRETRPAADSKATTPAPQAAPAARLAALTLIDAAGKPQPLAQWSGRVQVVNFWATWCPPCREEMPMFARAARELGDKVQFIGVGIDTTEAIADYAAKNPMPYPLLAAGNEAIEISGALGNEAMSLPFTVVIDAAGRLRAKHMGRVSDEKLREMLAAAG